MENHIKAWASGLGFLSLTAAVVLAFAPLSANARGQVPFYGAFDTVVELTFDFPMLKAHITGDGIASHLGLTTFETTDQAVNVLNNHGTATYYFTAANGDQIEVKFDFTAPPTEDGTGVTLIGTWTITSGTGLYAGASGSGTADGWAIVLTPTTGVGHFTMTGTISSPGSLK